LTLGKLFPDVPVMTHEEGLRWHKKIRRHDPERIERGAGHPRTDSAGEQHLYRRRDPELQDPELGRNAAEDAMTSEPVQTTLADFRQALQAADQLEPTPPVVGGQAASFRGRHFASDEPGIRSIEPLVSEDLDLFGGAKLLQRFYQHRLRKAFPECPPPAAS
jgi:hypothetical protein